MSAHLVFVFSSFFVFFIPSTISLTFNLSRIGSSDSRMINSTGGGYVSDQGIQVTTNERSSSQVNIGGRATYIEHLHLWDRASNNLSDFSTHFSFVIDSRGRSDFGDGLTFFLAPVGSTIQSWSLGGSLAIGNNNITVNSSSEAFVAVEFDTFPNFFDPGTTHVGIDINSMISVKTARWENNVSQGVQNDAWISYNATSMELRVDFTGTSSNRTRRDNLSHVVDLREYLPEYVAVGFSAATGSWFEEHTIKSWAFSSTLQIKNVTFENPGVVITGGGKEKKSSGVTLVVGLSVGLSILVLASAFAGYFLWRRKKQKKRCKKESGDVDYYDPRMDIEFQKGSGPNKFSYSELVLATKDFAEEEKLGEGGFGGVYRGFLAETNSYIAVKRVSSGSKQGLKEYASEVKIISQLRHRNLVQLIGWCHERGELLLVYELMPNGSLDSHLFKGQTILPWEVRYKIAQGIASALLYLHEEWEQAVVHRDIKASNIMLDSNFNAKLGDFGLARFVDHEKGAHSTVLAGTLGYMAPECMVTGRASKETDVYSLGIVMLEIACGRRPIDHSRRCGEDRVVLVEWVWRLYGKGELLEAADPKLETEFDEQEMERLMIVALWCVHPDSVQRPSIRQAVHVLDFEAELPLLPPMMPVPTYFAGGAGDSTSYNHYSDSSNLTASSGSSTSALLTS
ncbi:hypothetical protein MIMGU_mgv1a022756mg [Erythranthe guttata]|uniref:non-specific serine/threonine protein kinase n=2 Tax=Erythranthe guttata TaxID=4155 RepID=A0A022PVW4_ERYGU|nr:hypothetical protein MIMGU_mgv1a022756mg [Erythranthe guttata]